jgi:hypothetical protein
VGRGGWDEWLGRVAGTSGLTLVKNLLKGGKKIPFFSLVGMIWPSGWAFLTPGERNPDTRGIAFSHICVGMPMVVVRQDLCDNFGEFYRQCTATDKGYPITPWHPETGD